MKQFSSMENNKVGSDDGTTLPRQLPNEIVSLIIHHIFEEQQAASLHECTLVSKQFYLVANPLLYQVINNSERFLACLSDCSRQRRAILGYHIRDLRLCGRRWTDDQLSHWIPCLPLLKHLAVHSNTYITDISFQHLPRHCQQLTSLRLGMTGLTQVSFSAIGEHCHQLAHLHWNVSGHQSSTWLALLNNCPLERLRVSSLDVPLNSEAVI